MSEHINGEVVVITGSSSGFGEAAARLLTSDVEVSESLCPPTAQEL